MLTAGECLNFQDSSDYLGISKKWLENYCKAGQEMPYFRSRANLIYRTDLDTWRANRDFSTVQLNYDDYISCLKFAIRSYYHYRGTTQFGTTEQRGAEKFVSDFIIGKLGEIAVQRFLRENFNIEIRLDFELREAVVGQDITEIARPRRGRRVFNPLRLRVAVKTTKMKNCWLIVPAIEGTDRERRSDYYVLSRVDLPKDHFLRLIRSHESLSDLDVIPMFDQFAAQVVGFCSLAELVSRPPVIRLPNPAQDIQSSYIARTGDLIKSRQQWERLINRL